MARRIASLRGLVFLAMAFGVPAYRRQRDRRLADVPPPVRGPRA